MLSQLRRWMGRPDAPASPVPPLGPAPVMPVPPTAPAATPLEALWSEGFSGPGRAEPVLDLIGTLRPPRGAPVLLLGAGMGGPAFALAAAGYHVTALEADAASLARAKMLAARDRPPRLALGAWDPAAPALGPAAHDHAILLEVRDMAPALVLPAIIAALRPGGQLAMTALIADRPLPPDVAPPGTHPPSELAVTRVLLRLGCEVFDTADIGAVAVARALSQWSDAVRAMERSPPSRGGADMLAEAERWRARVSLMQRGAMRLVRWHVGVPRGPARV